MATFKQKTVVKDIVENSGKPVSKAMLDAGYSPSHAKNPQQLTTSKGWKELLEEYLPDDLLAKKHNELLNKDDNFAISRGLEMAYKLKGRNAPDKIQLSTAADSMPIEQIDVEIQNLENEKLNRLKLLEAKK